MTQKEIANMAFTMALILPSSALRLPPDALPFFRGARESGARQTRQYAPRDSFRNNIIMHCMAGRWSVDRPHAPAASRRLRDRRRIGPLARAKSTRHVVSPIATTARLRPGWVTPAWCSWCLGGSPLRPSGRKPPRHQGHQGAAPTRPASCPWRGP